jgi:hypothetical protein
MPELINIAIFLTEPIAVGDRRLFLQSIGRVAPEWLAKPTRVMEIFPETGKFNEHEWNGEIGAVDRPLENRSILVVHMAGADRASVSISEEQGASVYTISVAIGAFWKIGIVSVEQMLIDFYRLARTYSPCVLACGSELELDRSAPNLAVVVDNALSCFHNAYWAIVDPDTFQHLQPVPQGVQTAVRDRDYILLTRPKSIRAHSLLINE